MGGRPSDQTVKHPGVHFKWAADHLHERGSPVPADLLCSTATRRITCGNSNCRYGLPAGFSLNQLSDATSPTELESGSNMPLRLCLLSEP